MREAVRAAFARPIAHRGLHGGGAVENTLAAALAAIRQGYGIECDVLLSRDGHAMVCHDERLDRLAGLDVAVADLSAEALGEVRLVGGGAIPTLAALLRLVSGQVPLVVEIKGGQTPLADAVLAEVAGYGGPLLLESFDAATVGYCARAACPVGLVGPMRGQDSLAAVSRLPRCDFLSWSVDRVGEAAELCPALPLSAWTVRTSAQRAAATAAGAQIVFEGFRP